MRNDKKIAKEMLAFVSGNLSGVKAKNLDDWGMDRERGDFILGSPEAQFLGALFTADIKSELAWKAPYELKRRVGTINPGKLAKFTVRTLLSYMKRSEQHGPSLHRMPKKMAEYVILASKKIVREYRGDVTNIWFCPDGTPAKAMDVIKKLLEFKGISQKISRMLAILLVNDFGVALKGWERIDVAVDRHVARVFLRTGLVKRKEERNYKVSEVKGDVIQSARLLKPGYPGSLDGPAFAIGKYWCASEAAYCNPPGNPCPIRKSCRKNIGKGVAL